MAKKIRLDFSKVEERSGWKTNNVPEGLYEMKIEAVDDRDANDGTEMYTYALRPTDPKYKTRLFPYYCKQQQNQLFKIRDLHIAARVLDPKRAKGRAVDLIIDAPVGKLIAAEVRDGTGQYSDRSEIDGVYDLSIIEDSDDAPDDDEEYDDSDEEGEGEEEVDDEELREEIEALTLAALRKRAKGLGIDTDGIKKDELVELVLEEELGGEDEEEEDEDEDDLDDEDLEDEDLEDEDFDDEEDEEEEPEPAPKRRAAPARKPAAKAAPAKRVIKRR